MISSSRGTRNQFGFAGMNWLKRLRLVGEIRASSRKRSRLPLRCRPQLERLERRTLPSLVLQGLFTTGNLPAPVVLADVNTDGKLDLAVANETSNTVSVLLGNGDGTFAARQDFATGSEPLSLALADVNGDGKPDLAVANI